MPTEWNGLKVLFWGPDSQVRHGVVMDSSRLQDGTDVVIVKADSGRHISLPAAAVTLAHQDEQPQSNLATVSG